MKRIVYNSERHFKSEDRRFIAVLNLLYVETNKGSVRSKTGTN